MIKTLTIALIIAGLIIFFLILALIGQLDDLCEIEKEIERLNNELILMRKSNNYGLDIIEEKDKEIERLNNIINELDRESYLGMIENKNNNDYAKGLFSAYKYINDKIKELKGEDK